MRFKNFVLLDTKDMAEFDKDRFQPYFKGIEDQSDKFHEEMIVGKVRPWDLSDTQYVLYEDGDLILAELDGETKKEKQ